MATSQKGFTDFVLLEMNEQPAETHAGVKRNTAYPWAAHYVPVPDRKLSMSAELFEDLGVLKNGQWKNAISASLRKERLFCMEDGKKE